MLSFNHEFLVDLFRNDGKFAVELLRTCAGIAVDHPRVAIGSIDLSQVAPTEYRADAVVVLHEGRAEGREEGLRAAVIAFARAKLGKLSDLTTTSRRSRPCPISAS